MKIAIYGAGAMGTVLGAFMIKAGVETDLIARNKESVEKLNREGAHVFCRADEKEFLVRVNALTPDKMDKYDFIFLMTKQRDNQKIAEILINKLNIGGAVCTTQNGLPEEGLASILGEDNVLGGVCSFGANLIEPGKAELTSKISAMRIKIGSFSKSEEAERKAKDLEKILAKVANENFVEYTNNLLGARWNKLAINAAFSSLSTITGLTFGEIARGRKTKKVALAMIRESLEMQNALQIERDKMQGKDLYVLFCSKGVLGRWKAKIVLPIAMKKHKKLVSGMLLDLQRGKKCEIDYVAGAVVLAGKKLGKETPYLLKAVDLVHGIENGLYEISPKNIDFLI